MEGHPDQKKSEKIEAEKDFSDLPEEIKLIILTFLKLDKNHLPSLLKMRQVSNQFRRIVEDDTLWKDQIQERFPDVDLKTVKIKNEQTYFDSFLRLMKGKKSVFVLLGSLTQEYKPIHFINDYYNKKNIRSVIPLTRTEVSLSKEALEKMAKDNDMSAGYILELKNNPIDNVISQITEKKYEELLESAVGIYPIAHIRYQTFYGTPIQPVVVKFENKHFKQEVDQETKKMKKEI